MLSSTSLFERGDTAPFLAVCWSSISTHAQAFLNFLKVLIPVVLPASSQRGTCKLVVDSDHFLCLACSSIQAPL
jgi:hypothetical protein